MGGEPYQLTREDRLSLELHRAIGEKLRHRPEAVAAKGRANALRFLEGAPAHLRAVFSLWLEWLSLPTEALVEHMLAADENGVWMRHLTVFSGVLSASERTAVIRRCRRAA